jgi:hypothetical protein
LLAIAERQKQLQQMTGLCAVHSAEATVRNAPVTHIPPDIPAPIGKAEIILRTNKSGVAGVHRFPKYWGALTYFTTPGEGKKLISRYFSAKTHGEEKAKALAIAERQKQLERVARLIPRKATKRGAFILSPGTALKGLRRRLIRDTAAPRSVSSPDSRGPRGAPVH